MMQSQYSESHTIQAIMTLESILQTIFELDADIVFDAVKNDIPGLSNVVLSALSILKSDTKNN